MNQHESNHAHHHSSESSNVTGKDKKKKNEGKGVNDAQEITHFESDRFQEADKFTHIETDDTQDADRIITLEASNDATVSKKNRTGRNMHQQLLRTSASPRIFSFIEFELPENVKNVTLKSAKLELFVLSKMTRESQVTVKPSIASLGADSVTWENAPRKTGPQYTSSTGPANASSHTWITIDITEAIKWSIGKMGYSSLTLHLSSTGSLSFASRDYKSSVYAPQIVLQME